MAPLLSTFGSAASRNYGLGLIQPKTTQIQTFNSTDNWTAPAGVTEIDYLIVAGGGGGGTNRGGGGGAGGFRVGTGQSVSAGTTYTMTVGAGGAGLQTPNGGDRKASCRERV